MNLIENFLNFHENLEKKHGIKRYKDLLDKRPFVEIENDSSFSSIHDLIDEGYLDFISLDIGHMNSTKYTVSLSEKAIKAIKENEKIGQVS